MPFVIIENALKYAPYKSEIVVKFQDDTDKTVVRFESYGPRISVKEKSRIFDRNFRGDAAIASGPPGSGIGLYAAKTITEVHFGGKIFVNQFDDLMWIDGKEYFPTRFTIVLPSSEENQIMRRPFRPIKRKI